MPVLEHKRKNEQKLFLFSVSHDGIILILIMTLGYQCTNNRLMDVNPIYGFPEMRK